MESLGLFLPSLSIPKQIDPLFGFYFFLGRELFQKKYDTGLRKLLVFICPTGTFFEKYKNTDKVIEIKPDLESSFVRQKLALNISSVPPGILFCVEKRNFTRYPTFPSSVTLRVAMIGEASGL